MLLLVLAGCLINHDLYERRRAELLADGETSSDGGDETCETVWYLDLDGDDYGDAMVSVQACSAPEGYVEQAGDCDDRDAAVHPTADELPYDGLDNDCQGGDLVDIDSDGHDAAEAGGPDCDDQDPQIHPGASETWDNGATDNDCDGDRGAALLEFGAEAWTGEATADNAGIRLSTLGDVNGDGLAEFVASSIVQSGDFSYGGAIYIVSGGEPGPLADEGVVRSGGSSWMIGNALDGGPDIDGDGLPDLLVGAAAYDGGRGAAWLLSGADLPAEGEDVALPDIRSWELLGDQPDAYLGAAVGFVGDVDGDGLNDVAVSESYWDGDGLNDAGRVGIWNAVAGAAVMDDAELLLRGFYDQARLGGAIQGAGDQDGDGYDDYVISYGSGIVASLIPGGLGTSIHPEDNALTVWYLEEPAEWVFVKMIGDIDGDGRRDAAMVIDNYDVYLHSALALSPSRTASNARTRVEMDGDSYVFDLVELGDLDADGCDETLIPAKWYSPVGGAQAGVLFGSDVLPGSQVAFATLELRALSERASADFGYRTILAGDVTGSGRDEVVLAGPGDDQRGTDVGALAILPVPR